MTFKPEDLPFACTDDHEELVGYVDFPQDNCAHFCPTFSGFAKMGVFFERI